MRLIEFSIKRGLATFDLTVGDEPYKRDWADHSTALYDYTQGVSIKGRLAVALRDAVERSKKRAKQNDRLIALVRWVRNRRLELS
jgi:CelD/BcsL family acetyltransferase involved in cellulose biosynthesis